LRNGLVAALVAVALFALAGFLILPVIAKGRLEAAATQELGRRATLGKLEFNPFTLRARLTDFALADRDPQRVLAKFAALDVDLSLASLWKRAPVFDAVRLTRPQVNLTRNDDGTYSIDDLIERLAAEPDGPQALFSINNIEVDDGAVALDDRPHRRNVVVSNIGIGIPFLSSFPYDAQIHVTPRFGGTVDGSRFALTGTSTSPFEDTQEATLELNLDALPLAKYAEYASLPRGLKLKDGTLTTRLTLAFVTDKGVARAVSLAGTARVDRLAFARADDSPLAAVRAIDVALAKLDWLQRSIALDRVAIDGPDIALQRGADGTLEFERLLATPAPPARGSASRPAARPSPAQPGAPSAAPWKFAVAAGRITNGVLKLQDESVSPSFDVVLSNVAFEGRGIASSGKAGTFTIGFDSDEGARLDMRGELDVAARAAKGHFALTQFRLAKLYPYYASALNVDVRKGTLDLAGDFDAARQGETLRFRLAQGAATLADLETAIRGERDAFWRFSRGSIEGVAVDLAGRSVAIDHVDIGQGAIRVARQANGVIDFQRLVRAPAPMDAQDRRADKDASAEGWTVDIRKFDVERLAADIDDRAVDPPVKLRLPDVRLAAENVGNKRGSRASLEVAARIGASGRLRMKGALAADPPGADFRIDASGIDLVPLRPYYEARTNVIVTSGSVAAKGRLTYATSRTGSPRAGYAGDVTISGFGSLDRPTSQELMRWKTLTLTGVDAATEPFKLALATVAMDGFYARVIVNPDATLNLQQLLAPGSAAAQEASAGPSATTVGGVTTKALPPESGSALPVSIGRIELANGEVQYSDFFVKPNYTAHLTGVNGNVSSLSAAQAGTVEIAARVEGTAPVDVRGTLNPFAPQLQLDLTGKAADVDLPPLTPYSVKYAGYGIQKGKLSLEVHYKVDDRKLAASNKLKLDQLTFGERVDSPTATKLPVLLAVSLLKDRNGVINLDLPIQGTLDDPRFSVWGVLVQIFVNLITKAVTAPFALLGAIAGGGGEQLAYVEFAPGRAELTAESQTKLRSLAKALADRPGLKLDATGRAVPEADREGLKQAMLDRALRVQKQKGVARSGQSAPPLDALTIDAEEYPGLLGAVYRDADLPDKPRNVLGIAKTIPPEEMKALLLSSYKVDDEALAALANRRAQAVKEWFAGEGGVAPERLFIVAPKLTGDGIADKGLPTRVDFAIR
jgi:uncharacterized protein involved in outer membrane biogenesis